MLISRTVVLFKKFSLCSFKVTKQVLLLLISIRSKILLSIFSIICFHESGLFEFTMEACDGAEVCELVGTYMLSLISEKHNKKDFGLYYDDGLGLVKNKSGPETEKIKKDKQKILNENKLATVI